MNHSKAGILYDVWKETSSLSGFVARVKATPFVANLDEDQVRAAWYAFEAVASLGMRTGNGQDG